MLRTTGKFQPTFTATLFQQLFHVQIRLRSRFKPLAGVCICSKISKLMYFASIFAIFSMPKVVQGNKAHEAACYACHCYYLEESS